MYTFTLHTDRLGLYNKYCVQCALYRVHVLFRSESILNVRRYAFGHMLIVVDDELEIISFFLLFAYA